jgi:hypothetical protein
MDGTRDEASEAGRSLVRARWGSPSPVLSRAVQTLAERRGELDEALRAQLRQIAGTPARDGDGDG